MNHQQYVNGRGVGTPMYQTWGAEGIDQKTHDQMLAAMTLPHTVTGALMPDAHLGYGLPIGGVLALDNAVCPYAVGVDIACRMKMSVFPIDPTKQDYTDLGNIIEESTFFGVGQENDYHYIHEVMLKDWFRSPVTMENKPKAGKQLGTSGSGNHFVEFGRLVDLVDGKPVGDPMLALMSHSGSRGTGAAVCNYYSKAAKAMYPEFGDLAYFLLGTELGDEYWHAMNLMGHYAAANHDLIHRTVASLLGKEPSLQIENHHNFAWKERHAGRDVIVHRKGATPAGEGVMGVIPGSMGTSAFVVKGLGNPESLCSASHGAGRLMSRTQAKKTFDRKTELEKLEAQGIRVLSCGADEVPGVYKDIHAVMAAQTDLVQPIAEFFPMVVKMSADGKAED